MFGRARVQRSVFGFGQKPNFRLKQLLKTTAPRSRVAPTPRYIERGGLLVARRQITTLARMLSLPTLRNLHGRGGSSSSGTPDGKHWSFHSHFSGSETDTGVPKQAPYELCKYKDATSNPL